MAKHPRILITGTVLGIALALVVSANAQQPPNAGQQTPQAAGAPTETPTKKDPLKFRAVTQVIEGGGAAEGVTEIHIERWTTDDERTSLLKLVNTAKEGERGQSDLLKALEKIRPRVGFIKLPNTLGKDLQYAYETTLPDGTRQIVIATDRPVSGIAAATDAKSQDYPFTLIEMRMKPNAKGEGKMLAASAITTKNGRLELENYGNEPVRLTEITQEQKKN
jgi:hypothetical protein